MFRRDLLKSVVFSVSGAGHQSGASSTATVPGLRGTFIEARDGTRLFHRDWGTGSPMVFVPPWSLNADWFEYQMTPLSAQGLRCVAYDRRGHGRSDEPGRGYDFDTLADDLATVIERLDLSGVTLVGHSMGVAEVARYLARHKPARVARVVLIAPITPFTLKTPDNPNGVDRSVLEKGRAALSRDRPGQIAQAAPAFFGPHNGVSAAMLAWWTDMIVERCSLKVMLDLHRGFTETDFRPDLRTIALPTLIVHGDKDTSTPLDTAGRGTAALISGSRLSVYEGAAHGLPITHAERLNQDLLAFAKG
jgi:non-heme chloroperoxidase